MMDKAMRVPIFSYIVSIEDSWVDNTIEAGEVTAQKSMLIRAGSVVNHRHLDRLLGNNGLRNRLREGPGWASNGWYTSFRDG